MEGSPEAGAAGAHMHMQYCDSEMADEDGMADAALRMRRADPVAHAIFLLALLQATYLLS